MIPSRTDVRRRVVLGGDALKCTLAITRNFAIAAPPVNMCQVPYIGSDRGRLESVMITR
jgi:hypothetical protein